MCPYLDDIFCEISGRRLLESKIEGMCDTSSYVSCPIYSKHIDDDDGDGDEND
ncbi:MAG: hypothetical protein LBM38_04100 [Clostridiales bacterium]|jgi:hypothetical protein|nr:hypothetical protein [Clostridiales bacterium]